MTSAVRPPRIAFLLIFPRLFFFSGLLLLLAGCASRIEPVAALAPGVTIPLPPPRYEQPFQRDQLLAATVDGFTHQLQTALEVADGKITLVGLSPVGARLFKVVYTAEEISAEQLLPLADLPPPNQVLADIMLGYWPTAAWQPLLPRGWSLRDDTPALRTLRDAEENVVEEIFYLRQNGRREPVRIKHHLFHYEIFLQNLDGA